MKNVVPVIIASVAALCSFLAFIFTIVLKGDAWAYLDVIFKFLGIAGLLTLVILKLVNINISKLFYTLPLIGFAIASLLTGIHALIEIGDTYKFYRYHYFSQFILSLISIAAMGLFIFSILKDNFVLSATSLMYLAAGLFNEGLTAFNGTLFSMTSARVFKQLFYAFMSNSASFLFFVTLFWLALEFHNSAKNRY